MELELRSIMKGAIVKNGLAIHSYEVENSDDLIEKWVNE